MCSNKYFVDDGSEYIESLKRHERYNCSLSRTYGAHPAYVSVSLVFVSVLRREVFAKWTPLSHRFATHATSITFYILIQVARVYQCSLGYAQTALPGPSYRK